MRQQQIIGGRRRGVLAVIQEQDRTWAEKHHLDRDEESKREFQRIIANVKKATIDILKKQGKLNDLDDKDLKPIIRDIVGEVLQTINPPTNITPTQAEEIKKAIVDDITGLGPLEPLLKNPEITEIMVNNAKTVFVEQNGKIKRVQVEFEDDAHVRHVIDRIIAPLGRRIDDSCPMVDARLPDGSRVNATIPPIAIDGPNITIRKFPEQRLYAEDLIALGSATSQMMEFLEACVRGKRNIVVSGGTGSGKTTLLNILSNYIPLEERIVTIEDSAELRLHHMEQGNIIRLETRPPNIEGKGEITIRDLVKVSLRQRPDRIIVGECRSGEAYDMLQAMNTGHEGSLTTVHANSPRDCITRLESLVMQGSDLPHKVVRYNIGQAIHLIIQQARLQDGSRKIVSITEVCGYDPDEDRIILNEIFRYEQKGVDANGKVVGSFVSTGNTPTFLPVFEAMGIHVDKSMFKGGVLE